MASGKGLGDDYNNDSGNDANFADAVCSKYSFINFYMICYYSSVLSLLIDNGEKEEIDELFAKKISKGVASAAPVVGSPYKRSSTTKTSSTTPPAKNKKNGKSQKV